MAAVHTTRWQIVIAIITESGIISRQTLKSIRKIQGIHRFTGQQLRRARRLYRALVYNACLADMTGKTLNYCVERARNAGLFAAATNLRDIRWSFLRQFWRMTPGYDGTFGWSRWMRDYGLGQARFNQSVFNARSAA